jgi:hypothetical protein
MYPRDRLASATIIERFLEQTASQLTYYGLSELHQKLKEGISNHAFGSIWHLLFTASAGELVVFFRNNHFSTMVKFQNELFLLVTDLGYLSERDIVWEKLSEVCPLSRVPVVIYSRCTCRWRVIRPSMTAISDATSNARDNTLPLSLPDPPAPTRRSLRTLRTPAVCYCVRRWWHSTWLTGSRSDLLLAQRLQEEEMRKAQGRRELYGLLVSSLLSLISLSVD